MIQVLFVDDDPRELAALQSQLEPLRARWQMSFAQGPEEALRQLANRNFDVLFTDLHMPGMDGPELLKQSRLMRPHMVRLLAGSSSSQNGLMKAFPDAHQVLTRPLNIAALESAVERASALQTRLTQPAVRAALGSLKSLPALPRLYTALNHELENPDSTSQSVAAIVEQDVGMTARVLQVANSAFFAAGRRFRNVQDAVTYLGLLPMKSVVLSLELIRAMGEICAPRGFSFEALQQHSLQVARIAFGLLRDPDERKTAFSAGMLHDLGSLVLAIGMPERCIEIRETALRVGLPRFRVEQDIIGCTHAEVGAHLLSIWDLPAPLVEAVAFHHQPALCGDSRFGVAGAIHVADALAHAQEDKQVPGADARAGLDFDYLKATNTMHLLEVAPAKVAGAAGTVH